jgi:hypothetical protein
MHIRHLTRDTHGHDGGFATDPRCHLIGLGQYRGDDRYRFPMWQLAPDDRARICERQARDQTGTPAKRRATRASSTRPIERVADNAPRSASSW